jgi:PAS domain-containing protein
VADLLGERPTFEQIISQLAERRSPVSALTAPDRWASDRLARHAIATGGHVQALADGRWIQINELRTSEGGIVGIYTDITEAKAEDARARARDLAEQNLALQALLDNLVEGVCMFDAERKLTAWNGALQRLLGIAGDAGRELHHHDDLVRLCSTTLGMDGAEVLAWRTEDEVAVRNRLCQVGDRIWEVRTTATALGGMVVGLLDVTEPTTARQLLQNTAETLERRVTERTTELLSLNQRLASEVAERRAIEAQLLEAKTLAEGANRSKTSFLAAASHDLLQPLNAARLFIAALTERRLALPTRALVNQASTSLNSVEDLLETLFEISRLDAGAITPDLTDVNLTALLATLQTEFAPTARSAGLAFVVEPANVWVRSDARLLRRILQNLVSNAIRYTGHGEVRVKTDHPPPDRSGSACATRGRASRATSRNASSRNSAASTPATAFRARGWGWPSCAAPRRCCSIRSNSCPMRARARASWSPSRKGEPGRYDPGADQAHPRPRDPGPPHPRRRQDTDPAGHGNAVERVGLSGHGRRQRRGRACPAGRRAARRDSRCDHCRFPPRQWRNRRSGGPRNPHEAGAHGPRDHHLGRPQRRTQGAPVRAKAAPAGQAGQTGAIARPAANDDALKPQSFGAPDTIRGPARQGHQPKDRQSK